MDIRENAAELLDAYLKALGGRDKIAGQSKLGAQKKRGRPSSTSGTPANGTKRSKRGEHPASSTPPASAAKAWTLPAGSWEEHVASIDACHDEHTGKLVVYLTWKNGNKTQHDTKIVYSRCPQKVRWLLLYMQSGERSNCSQLTKLVLTDAYLLREPR